MPVWALADLHLSFGVPDKEMDVFGPQWISYTEKVEHNWRANISHDDLVLIPGDISWAMHPEEAKADLDWIDRLPGTKLLLRGNHDYWWTSLNKIEAVRPQSIHYLQNNAFQWHDVSVAGARLWDSSEYNFGPYINYQKNERAKPLTAEDHNPIEAEKIFQRELGRLEMSLKCLDKSPKKTRLVMTHYPPIGADLHESRVSRLLEKNDVRVCVFGHLHNVRKDQPLFGKKNGIDYLLTACDYVDFEPIKIFG